MPRLRNTSINVAIVGVGNCASSLVQGVCYYSKKGSEPSGLMYKKIGKYDVSDIKFVAAFDIDKRKVGKDLSKAIFAQPNCTKRFSTVRALHVTVQKGEVLDGVAPHMKETFIVDPRSSVNVSKKLKEAGADICICYLPVGSFRAARFYAQAAMDAGVAFINAIPEFICSDQAWSSKFKERGIPCAGDDIKSQVGATIVHRTLARLLEDRGYIIDNTYQLNIGGNTDFLNMKDEERIQSKRISKTNAVTSILDKKNFDVRIGPSDYISHLKDNKVCYINFKGKQFGGIPFEMDLKLSIEDSPNSAGVIIETIRALKIAKDKKLNGNINEISAYMFKSPQMQVRDDQAKRDFERFINS